MTVATYTQPNFTQQVGAAYKNNIDAATAAPRQTVDGFLPHEAAPPDMTVVIDAGKLVNSQNQVVEVAQQTTAAIVAPTTNPRHDLVVIDAETGAVDVVTGTEAGSPTDPAIGQDQVAVARVRLAVSTTAIDNSLIDNLYVARAGRGAFSEYGESDPIAIAYGTTTTIPISALTPALTGKPHAVECAIVLTAAQGGFAVGDEITTYAAMIDNLQSATVQYLHGWQAVFNATEIKVTVGQYGILYFDTSGARATLSPSNAHFIVRAWR